MLASWKVDNYLVTVDSYKLYGLELRVRQRAHLLRETEMLQHRPTRRIQTIAAHFFSGEFFPLKNKRPQPGQRTKRRAARPSRAAADDGDIKNLHDNA